MSTTNIIEFNKRIQSDEALKAELDEIKNDDGYVPAAEIIRLAEKHDCPFTLDELKQAAQGELSDEQLDNVAAGFFNLSYFSNMTFVRTGTDKVEEFMTY